MSVSACPACVRACRAKHRPTYGEYDHGYAIFWPETPGYAIALCRLVSTAEGSRWFLEWDRQESPVMGQTGFWI